MLSNKARRKLTSAGRSASVAGRIVHWSDILFGLKLEPVEQAVAQDGVLLPVREFQNLNYPKTE